MDHTNKPDPEQDAPNAVDPVEGRTDGELWKRQRPEGEAPARSGGDEDVTGARPPATAEEHKAELGERPSPGLLDANANATPSEEKELKDQHVPPLVPTDHAKRSS